MDPFILAEMLAAVLFLATIALLMTGYPVAFVLGGISLLIAGIGWCLGVFDLVLLRGLPSRYLGTMTNEVLVAVPMFVFMGVVLERARIAEDLLEGLGRLLGRVQGGLGLSVILVGMLLAASTGVVGATVVTMGLLSLPTMLRAGYDPRVATGVICASGTLGQIIPPSIVLVLLADYMSGAHAEVQRSLGNYVFDPVSVSDLFAGALVPGLLLVVLYMAWQVIVAIARPQQAPSLLLEGEARPPVLPVLLALAPPLGLVIVVLGSILVGAATPTEAAAVGSVGALLLAGARNCEAPLTKRLIVLGGLALVALVILSQTLALKAQDMGPSVVVAVLLCVILSAALGAAILRVYREGILRPVMRSTMEIAAMVFVILLGASLFSLVFRGLGGDEMVARLFDHLPGGQMAALLAVMLVIFVLGFFLDFFEIVFVVVPIVAPVLLAMGMDPTWLAILIAVNLQTSFLTPPFGFALFYLRGVAPEGVSTRAIYAGVLPFVAIQIAALALLILVPDLVLALPRALGL